MRLPKHTITPLAVETGISAHILYEYVATRMRPGRKRALLLEKACRKIGRNVPAITWLYGKSNEIKAALMED